MSFKFDNNSRLYTFQFVDNQAIIANDEDMECMEYVKLNELKQVSRRQNIVHKNR